MTNRNVSNHHHKTFESIKHIDKNGNEYWRGRQLAKMLGYVEYRNFQSIVERAKEACENNDQRHADHFVDITHMVEIGSGAKRTEKSLRQIAANKTKAVIPFAFQVPGLSAFGIQSLSRTLVYAPSTSPLGFLPGFLKCFGYT